MEIDGQNWFPYLPSSWLQRLVDLIRRSVPSRIDADWCMESDRFSFTRNNASQFVSQLRTLGWIDEDGSLTDVGRNLRLQGGPYQEFMRSELARIYGELIEQLHEETASRETVETYFTAASSLGLSGRRQVITTLRWFLAQANEGDASERLGGAPQAGPPRPRRQPRSSSDMAQQPAQRAGRTGQGERAGNRASLLPDGLSGLTLSISLQLPAVDDERVYQAIFRAMRENLFEQTGSDTTAPEDD